MGLHKQGQFDSERTSATRGQRAVRFVSTVALSTLVGSAATFCTLSALHTAPRILSGAATPTMAPIASSEASTTTEAATHANLAGFAGSQATSAAVRANASTPAAVPVNVNVNDGIIDAVKQVEPAVMGVVNYASVADFFTQQTKLEATGIGTGVLFNKSARFGYVVTNNHVVEGANKVQVVLGSGHHVQAEVVGTDPYTDLAVLRIPISSVRSIKAARFANSDQIQVGEPAIAIGTPMGLDFADTVTAGIVSAKKRIMPVSEPQTETVLDYQAVIQTDAAINPGNSGGPLCNIRGEVIGINSSKIVAQNFEGMGFAIPANEVVNIANQLMTDGHALHPSLGVSGYSLASLPDQMWPNVPVDYGVWVQAISSTGTRLAGLKPQDVIVSIDNHVVQTMADLRTYLFQEKAGQTVTLKVYRNRQELTIKVKLSTMETQNSASTGSSQSAMGSGVNAGNNDSSSFSPGLFDGFLP